MTIDLGTHTESTSMVAMATSNIPCNTYYCVFLDNGNVYEHQTLHTPSNTCIHVHKYSYYLTMAVCMSIKLVDIGYKHVMLPWQW